MEVRRFERLPDKGISSGAPRNETAHHHGLDVHIVGAGNSAGDAAMFLATHARSVTILCRNDSLEKSVPRFLIGQLAAREISTRAN